MLKNYFLTTLRNALRQKVYTLLNIFGLTIGLASAILIFIWILDELRYDQFHADGKRLFNVMEHQTYSGNQIYTFLATPGPLAPALKDEIPEIEQSARSTWGDDLLFNQGEKSFHEHGLFADGSLFQLFSFNVHTGDPDNPLPDESSVVISKRMAEKYFDDGQAVGKVFKVNNKYDLVVSAVYENMPDHSSLKPDFVIPFVLYERENDWLTEWGSNGIRTYVKLKDASQVLAVNEKIGDFIKKRNEGSVVDLFLYPYEKAHLYGTFKEGKQSGGLITIIRLLAFVGVFIIIIACINFMNLATARSTTRSKEVGVRKVIGAQRRSLVIQFIGESLMMAMVALILSLVVVQLLLPGFNLLTDKSLALRFNDPYFTLPVLGIAITAGLLAGSYPSFFLSSFQPVKVLKGAGSSVLGGSSLRKVLVVFQFSLSVMFIISTIVIYNQIGFIMRQDIGYDRENIVHFMISPELRDKKEAFRSEALNLPGIREVASSSNNPMNVGNSTGNVGWPGKQPDDNVLFQVIRVSHEFADLMNIQFLKGRNFRRDNMADSVNFIVNEETVSRMNLEDPIGQEISCYGRTGKIIGITKNFNTSSLHNPYEPVILVLDPAETYHMFVGLEAGAEKETVPMLESLYKQFDMVYPLEYRFMDQEFERMYKVDLVVSKLSVSFTVIAVLISCLGLFGLASYSAERRIKEIGIRKALGASVQNLVVLLCRDFTKLVLIALCIGSPLAYYFMNNLLDQYAFRIEIQLWVFVITSIAILFIALVTVIFQSAKAALVNPSHSLRNE